MVYSSQQVWFQNRRARYFKSKKSTREAAGAPAEDIHLQWNPAPYFPTIPGLSTEPDRPAPGLSQSNGLSTHLDFQDKFPPVPDLSQDSYLQTIDITDFCQDVLPHSSLEEWDFTDLEAFLGGAQESQPLSSLCGPDEAPRSPQDHRDFSGTHEFMDDLSDLCLKDLVGDLEISAAMIDYLLG